MDESFELRWKSEPGRRAAVGGGGDWWIVVMTPLHITRPWLVVVGVGGTHDDCVEVTLKVPSDPTDAECCRWLAAALVRSSPFANAVRVAGLNPQEVSQDPDDGDDAHEQAFASETEAALAAAPEDVLDVIKRRLEQGLFDGAGHLPERGLAAAAWVLGYIRGLRGEV
jgi:hypothetical protein